MTYTMFFIEVSGDGDYKQFDTEEDMLNWANEYLDHRSEGPCGYVVTKIREFELTGKWEVC